MAEPAIEAYFFEPKEFRGWYNRLNPRLLFVSDLFRAHWGKAVLVSPSPGALGRYGGDSMSSHNVDRWGWLNATDFMPQGMVTRKDAERAIECAKMAGATGIGIYPFWSPYAGIHLDVRPDREPLDPATWGRVERNVGNNGYVSVATALSRFPNN